MLGNRKAAAAVLKAGSNPERRMTDMRTHMTLMAAAVALTLGFACEANEDEKASSVDAKARAITEASVREQAVLELRGARLGISSEIEADVELELDGAIESAIADEAAAAVDAVVEQSVEAEVEAAVAAEVASAVDSAVESEVEAAVESEIESAVAALVGGP
jgi:hypothetical protein